MKKVIKKIGFGLLGLIVLLLLISFLLPSTMKVERSIEVDAPLGLVFSQVNDLRNWEQWSPWKKLDPDMQLSYSNPPAGEGAFYIWSSEHPWVGNGKLTLSEVQPNQLIRTTMEFEEWDSGSAAFQFEEVKGDVEVTWSMESEVGWNPFSKYMSLFMRGSLKDNFDEGLAGIKSAAEGR